MPRQINPIFSNGPGRLLSAQWRPHDDPLSPVRMRPGLRAGRPAVRGISTEILWEHEQSGETIAEVAEEYSLSDGDVVDADLLGVAKILVQIRGDVTSTR
jgi:uncharacterized protein (DUF433 family)